jgi:hypothetical protein
MTKTSSAKSTLAKYRAKRNLAETPEPTGKKAVPTSTKLRFVIQCHRHRNIRLELDGVFKFWAVTSSPSLDPHDKRLRSRSRTTRSTMAISKAPFPMADSRRHGATVGAWLMDSRRAIP